MRFALVVLLIFFTHLFLHAQSVLRITLSGTASYLVTLDGNQQQAHNNQITFSQLNSGKLPIKIVEQLENGMTKIVYNGFVTVPLNTEIIAIYQPHGIFTIFSSVSLTNSISLENTNGVTPSAASNSIPGKLCMSETEFQKILLTVKSEVFDDKRTKLIVTAISNTAVSTDHAIQLLKLFTFDDKRLTCATELIPYICDRDNYWKAGETFTFSSNKLALLKKLE